VSYDRWLGLYAAAKIAPKIMTVPALPLQQATLLVVAAGRGICLASENVVSNSPLVADRSQGVAIVPLNEPGSRISVSMVWRANEKSSTVLEFLQSTRDAIRSKWNRRNETHGYSAA
jgi:DNA-binding transcriptional LysR family regulator